MKLRFEVDQAECFRRGIDAPGSIITIEVKPHAIDEQTRNDIADRLSGIDVCELDPVTQERIFTRPSEDEIKRGVKPRPVRVVARGTAFINLIEAIRESNKNHNKQKPQ